MKKFSFDLEGVLRIKEKLEGQAKIAFGLAMAALREEERLRDLAISEKERYEKQLAGLLIGTIDVREIGICRNKIESIEEEIQERNGLVKKAEYEVELARTKLNALMTERKSIAKLKEKKFNEYLEQLKKEEGKEVDELVSYRHTIRDVDNSEDFIYISEEAENSK